MFNNKASIFKNTNKTNRNLAPVSEGKEYTVKIEEIAQKGDGIARIDGYVIFIPNVKSGSEVKIRIERALPKYGFGTLIED